MPGEIKAKRSPQIDKHIMINSTSANQLNQIQWTSINSQMLLGSVNRTPIRSTVRDMNWNSPPIYSPGKIQGSPFPPLGINPMGNLNQNLNLIMNPNQRYYNMSITDGRPSEVEAVNLISQVLGPKNLLPNNINLSPIKPVLPIINSEYQQLKPSNIPQSVIPQIEDKQVRETVEIPVHQTVSTNSFKPVNIDDLPAQSSKQANLNKFESPEQEQYHDIKNSTQASIEVPKYNFEELLQKALEEQGEDPNSTPIKEDENPQRSNKKKPKFLKRKKRYDPQEAI